MCPLCNPGIEFHSGPGWRHLGSPHTRSRLCPLLPWRPRATPSRPSLSAAALPPWMPLSSATWHCCSRRSCPVGRCRPTCGGCPTSVPTAPTSSASTSPGMEVRPDGGGRQPLGQWSGVQGRAPPPTFLPCPSAEVPPPRQTPAGPETEEEPYGRRNQILSVLAGLAAMVGYALLSGIVSIQRAAPARTPDTRALGMAEEDEEE